MPFSICYQAVPDNDTEGMYRLTAQASQKGPSVVESIFCSIRMQRWQVLGLQSPVRPRHRVYSTGLTLFLHTPKVNTWDCPKRTSVLQAPQTGQCCCSPLPLMAGTPSSATSEGREGSRSRQGLHQFRNVIRLNMVHFSLRRTELLIPFSTRYFINRAFLMEQHNLKVCVFSIYSSCLCKAPKHQEHKETSTSLCRACWDNCQFCPWHS